MDRTNQAATLPLSPTWDAETLFARLPWLVRSLLVATTAPRPHEKDPEPLRLVMPAGATLACLLADHAGDQTQRLALLFTDIKDSSSLYERFGDAAASRIIRAHLEWLDRLVQRFGGVLLKTMGDGALAAFGDDAAAVAAAIAIQAGIPALNRALGEPGLVLRVGVHAGPCIVTRVGRSFDCFGTTVNLAARVLRMSSGTDIAVSEVVMENAAAAALLAEVETVRVVEVGAAQPLGNGELRSSATVPADGVMQPSRSGPAHFRGADGSARSSRCGRGAAPLQSRWT